MKKIKIFGSIPAIVTPFKKNGVLIPGANSSSYQVVGATLVQSGGLYSVMATNLAGSVTSKMDKEELIARPLPDIGNFHSELNRSRRRRTGW